MGMRKQWARKRRREREEEKYVNNHNLLFYHQFKINYRKSVKGEIALLKAIYRTV